MNNKILHNESNKNSDNLTDKIVKVYSFKLFFALIVVSFHQGAYAATSEKPAHLVSVKSVKKEQVNPSIWLPANVISRKNSPISAEQTGQLLWVE